MTPGAAAPARAGDKSFLGHPRGLFFLAFTEAWERFSYYGMTGLLALYMVNQLLLPGHVEHIGGFTVLRATLEAFFGPLSTQPLASLIFGLYSGFVYFTPLLGGMIADRWIGQRAAVTIGALSMSAGHLAMTFDQSFLAALLLLVIGSGFLKGNITAQVGALYASEDEARRTRGYVLFSTGINIGAIAGPMVCGLLAQVYGWHYGFGIAAIFMLAGLATYLCGYRYLPARVERRRHEGNHFTAEDRRSVPALLAVMGISILQSITVNQIFNVMPIWIQEHVASGVAGFRVPIPWYQSLYSVSSVSSVPLLFWLWRRQSLRRGEPDELAKIGTGAWIAMASNLILVAASIRSGGAPIHPIWAILYIAGSGVSFLYYWPTLLALVSRVAPARTNATLMGLAFMSLFISNMLIGWIGSYYEKMPPADFWAIHAAIAAAGGLLLVVFGRRLSRLLALPGTAN
ncbi:MAG TPA: peptide MFS transporter [Steroidobacteraceae bacterium]|nr:peptide MFS transporter [Steroidobacteraceae bacterium]